MDAGEFWSTGDYGIVGDLWSTPGRDLAVSLDVIDRDVIDIATGTGVTAIAVATRGARSVIGVDAAATLLTEAERRATDAGTHIRWVEADMAAVPLPDASADLVVSTFGLIFATDPAAALAECRRLVRPGGQIVFTSWDADGLFGGLRTTMSPYFPDSPEPWHEHPTTIRSMAGAAAQVDRRSFVMTVASPDDFVSQLERFNAPFLAAKQALGERWGDARAELVELVTGAGAAADGMFRADVAYLVTTMPTD